MTHSEIVHKVDPAMREQEKSSANVLVSGENAGRHHLAIRLRKLGFHLNAQEMRKAYIYFLKVLDQKKRASRDDLIYIAEISKETPAAI